MQFLVIGLDGTDEGAMDRRLKARELILSLVINWLKMAMCVWSSSMG